MYPPANTPKSEDKAIEMVDIGPATEISIDKLSEKRYQDNGRATAKAPLNMMRYLRPNKRYKSFSDAPFTLRIATSRERCLM